LVIIVISLLCLALNLSAQLGGWGGEDVAVGGDAAKTMASHHIE
jgi:hypothetical protein